MDLLSDKSHQQTDKEIRYLDYENFFNNAK